MSVICKSGGNGKIVIDLEKKTATKTLKRSKNKECQKRYRIEINALKQIKELGINNIVEIVEISEENEQIVMKAYNGELSELYELTRNNPVFSAKLLLPVVKALKELSMLENPIYHRDLKPANILYKKENESYQLYISDFGCCYFEQDDDRETPQFRAVGAQSFRAPEYDYGRVEQITTKGDVYSLGKIFWCMINGVKGDVFPYTLWFPREYNLLERFERNSELMHANLIIAKCVSINPDLRPSYDELIALLEGIEQKELTVEAEKRLKIELFTAQREHDLIEIKSMNRNMLELFYSDFYDILFDFVKKYSGFSLCKHLLDEYRKTYLSKQMHIEYKVLHDVSSYVFSTSYDNIYLAIHYHPTFSKKNGSDDDKYASISMEYHISSKKIQKSIEIRYENKVLKSFYDGNEALYSKNTVVNFLEEMIDEYITAF